MFTLYLALMICMFLPLKYTDCTLVMHPLHYGTDFSLHRMLTEQAEPFRMCVDIIPRGVNVKSYFQISCECIAFIADNLLCFGFPQPLCMPTHCTTHGHLLYVGIHTYNHAPGTYTCTSETTACFDYTLGLFVVLKMSHRFRFTNTYCYD